MITAHDINTLVLTAGSVRLFAGSDCAGPYVIRVGKVIVGAFGFNRDGQVTDNVDVCSHDQQLAAFAMAQVAFEAISLFAEIDSFSGIDSDPSYVREIARRACKASRRTWSVFGYGSTEQARESHADYVLNETAKVSA